MADLLTGSPEKQDVRCMDGESVFDAAKRQWGDDAYVSCFGMGKPLYAHSAPDFITIAMTSAGWEDKRRCLGTVTVRKGESFYVVSHQENWCKEGGD